MEELKEIDIKKAKIKSGMFLAYEYSERTTNAKNNISLSSDAVIHDDLRNAFTKLIPHFAFLTEEVMRSDVENIITKPYGEEFILSEKLEKFTVTGFSLGGSGDSEGVTLSGLKELSSGKKVNFNTPFQTFYDESNEAYPFTRELKDDVYSVIAEVMEYMEGKQAPPPMRSLFDGYDDDENESDDENEAEYKDVTKAFDLPEGMKVEMSVKKTKKQKDNEATI